MPKNKILYISLFALSALLICITIFTEKNFGLNISIEQIILVLTAHASNLSEAYKKNFFRHAYQLLIWCSVATFVYCILYIKLKNILASKIIRISTLFLFISTCYYFDSIYQISGFISAKNTSSNYIEENYFVDIDNITWDKKNNLVLIIAESLENTYKNTDSFENSLIPSLSKLQEENVAFHSHIETYGASWTIAGISSYLFGIPLKLPQYIYRNHMGLFFESFLPYAKSILIPLEQASYEISFFSNWDTTFSAYRSLIETHSNANNFDEIYFKNMGYTSNMESKWGIYKDAFIFDKSYDYFENKIKEEVPFILIITTVETHSPATQNDFMRLDKEIYDFIEKIQKIDNKNTTIIVLGDHLIGQREIDGVELLDRSIFNLIINPVKSPVQEVKNRTFTSLDFAPTILEAIGANIPHRQFGLGISLFSEKQTLLEQDFELYDEEIRKNSIFYNSFHGALKKK